MPSTHEAVKGAVSQVLAAGRDDGRYRVTTGTIYPCHTAYAARVLCRFGYARDRRMQRTFAHLLDSQHDDGGWRCNTIRLGRSPDTDASNPGVTLHVLDAFRFAASRNSEAALDRAVESLLNHWEVRRPVGPCRFGIGSLFQADVLRQGTPVRARDPALPRDPQEPRRLESRPAAWPTPTHGLPVPGYRKG
ncbi:MAG: hypothetical protein ACE5GX_19510 [Thermoanaerobaculia bacterium]